MLGILFKWILCSSSIVWSKILCSSGFNFVSYLSGFHLQAVLSKGLKGSVLSELFHAGEYLCCLFASVVLWLDFVWVSHSFLQNILVIAPLLSGFQCCYREIYNLFFSYLVGYLSFFPVCLKYVFFNLEVLMMSSLVELFKEKPGVISTDLIERGTVSIYELRAVSFYCETYRIIIAAAIYWILCQTQ